MRKGRMRKLAPLVMLVLVSLVGCKDDDETVVTDGGLTSDGGGQQIKNDAAPDGTSSSGDAGAIKLVSSEATWTIFPSPYPEPATPNPITAITGTVEAFDIGGGKTRFNLNVTGLPMNRSFGSHLHKLACADNKAGGHYQNVIPGDGGAANDPLIANAMNEVWLDFTTDATGKGTAVATVNWKPRAGEAKAIVIHDMTTGSGGAAGPKLACVGMSF
jgi:superoxide dismutase, Cu-Zn family